MNIRAAAVLLPLLLAACQATEPEVGESLELVDELSNQGRHVDALLAAEAYRQAHPDDPEGERQWRRAKAAVLLDEARRACFLEENTKALDLVREARKLAPDEPVITDWELKLQRKLATIHTGRGDEFFASTDLEAARVEYEKALTYVADEPTAKLGLAQVLIQLSYRRDRGEGYYEQGVHLLRDYWLEQAKTRFVYTSKYQPDNERAKDRRALVATQLAEQRCTLASGLESKGLWAAARNEYRIALLIDEDHAGAKAGLERTRHEAEAEDRLRDAERYTRNKQYDKAREAIEAGMALTRLQVDRFEGAKAGIDESIFEAEYQSAKALESDQEYEKAIAAYDQLLARRDYYKDALARRDTLKSYVEDAAALYAKALAATDPAEKLDYLRRIAVFWPEYQNVAELIEMLKPATKDR